MLLEVEPRPASPVERRALVEAIRATAAAGRGVLVGSRDEILLAAVAASVTIFEDGAVLADGPPRAVLPAAAEEARREGLA